MGIHDVAKLNAYLAQREQIIAVAKSEAWALPVRRERDGKWLTEKKVDVSKSLPADWSERKQRAVERKLRVKSTSRRSRRSRSYSGSSSGSYGSYSGSYDDYSY